MSFFYLTPIKGEMPAHMMETITLKRLEFLKTLINDDTITYNEYVIEGSVYDNVGHFVLCIISILGENSDFLKFVLHAELELFKRRLSTLGAYDLRYFAKKILKNIKKKQDSYSVVEPLKILCQHLMLKDLAQHLCSLHNPKCDVYKIKLNFRHCLSYIARREVEIQNGTVYLACGKWKQYLSILFRNHLETRLQNRALAALKSDSRIMELLHKVKKDFFPQNRNAHNILLSSEVDNKMKLFPPCMLNLHTRLRNQHRLSHSQRFYYSLFLKDIGMPVEEAVSFWREEYRLSPNGSHSCCHNWEKDEKKYLYGIRHMYGLEGARKNYTSVNCQRIQSIDNACTEGGCPFKSFDEPKLLQLLHSPSDSLILQINEFKRKHLYTKSCLLYLNSIVDNADCDSNFSHSFTPVKYYSLASQSDLKHL